MRGKSWEAGPCGRIPPSAASGCTPECFCSSNCSRRRCKNPFRWPQRQGRPRPRQVDLMLRASKISKVIPKISIFSIAHLHSGAKRLRSYTSHQSMQALAASHGFGSPPLFAEKRKASGFSVIFRRQRDYLFAGASYPLDGHGIPLFQGQLNYLNNLLLEW